MTWIAEDVAWHSVDLRERHPGMTDEDHAMSAPQVIAEQFDERLARIALERHLSRISLMRHVPAEQVSTYTAAGAAILSGVDGVRISGRYYRIREA